mmetsp:Transcript_55847/g.141624  ORF Transcript_55847/g.141624 Transcript_55847/m.141624 type:complete len:115 (+) Transcript_55847:191-535(+)
MFCVDWPASEDQHLLVLLGRATDPTREEKPVNMCLPLAQACTPDSTGGAKNRCPVNARWSPSAAMGWPRALPSAGLRCSTPAQLALRTCFMEDRKRLVGRGDRVCSISTRGDTE